MIPARLVSFAALGAALLASGCGSGAAHGADAASDGPSRDGSMDAGASRDGARDTASPDAWDGATDASGPFDGGGDGARDAAPDARAVPRCEADMDLGTATGIGVAAGTTRDAGDDLSPECSPSSRAPDVVFLWQAPSSGRFVFDTFDSAYDTVLHVRDSGCAPVACNDNLMVDTSTIGSSLSRVVVDVVEGQVLFVAVDGRGRGAGSFVLSITPFTEETACDDGEDNDRDWYVDCGDLDCHRREPDRCVERDCSDGVDNDGDLYTDCGDPDCQTLGEPCVELSCGDGLDNDGDGLVDCDDWDWCSVREPCVETTCGDAVDNDGDGATDCADTNCACSLACIPDPCPDRDLGSALGPEVARGSTRGRCDLRVPSLDGGCHFAAFASATLGTGPDETFRWTAPRTGTFTFSTEGSSLSAMLYLRDGECEGAELACFDSFSSGTFASVTAGLSAGQGVVVIIDAYLRGTAGDYVLNIREEP